MPRKKKSEATDVAVAGAEQAAETLGATKAEKSGAAELAAALVQAIELTRPTPKKTPFNRVVGTPWTPKDGSPKLKLKRKMYQHGIPLEADILSNQEIDLMNKVRPGVYLRGFLKIVRRKDRGLNINYSVKTASHRLRLVNEFGLRSLAEVLQRCIDEANNPQSEAAQDLDD